MRMQSEKKVTLRDKVIGGPQLLICLPIVAKNESELLSQAGELTALAPDLVEWRIDAYDRVEDPEACLAALKKLRAAIGNIPLIFTCRIAAEGGFQTIAQSVRRKLLTAAIQSGLLDIVDLELCNEPDFIDDVKISVGRSGAKLILSYHNFNDTPDEPFICGKLQQAQELAADIAKVAVMPKGYKDVLTLLSATLKARTELIKIPMVTMSMGAEGGVARLVGGLFGTDITFAIGKKASAPGQIPIAVLRQAMTALYT